MIFPDQIPRAIFWNMVYVMLAFVWATLILVFYVEFFRRRDRVLVRVKTPLGEKKIWKKPQPDGQTIVMIKSGKKKPSWQFTFTNKALFWVRRWFGFVRTLALEVFYDSPKAVEWDYELEESKQPKYDKATSKEWINAETLRKRATGIKQPIPPIILWLLIIISGITLVLVFMLVRRFGL